MHACMHACMYMYVYVIVYVYYMRKYMYMCVCVHGGKPRKKPSSSHHPNGSSMALSQNKLYGDGSKPSTPGEHETTNGKWMCVHFYCIYSY